VALPNPFSRRRSTRPTPTLEPQRDDLPKRGLFAEPIRVTTLDVLDPEVLDDGRHRVTFLVEVRDAEDRRCPDLAVEARVSGPDRTRTVQGATDLFGRIRFRMAGSAGTYAIEVTDVAAHGLDWARDASATTAEMAVG
jgi:hypothetical protein